jgi:hypothetical protein
MDRKTIIPFGKNTKREVRDFASDDSVKVEVSLMRPIPAISTVIERCCQDCYNLMFKIVSPFTFNHRSIRVRQRLTEIEWSSLLAFGLTFAVYVLTLAPTVYHLDSAELTTAAATGGITRATGYPLYLVLGFFWSRIPIGDIGYRMNLFSALCGALTIALVDQILKKQSISLWARMGSLGLLAFSTHFWGLSIIAEVYTLHTALMAALILLLIGWYESPTAKRLALVGLVFGLSLAHHGATLLLIPGIIWYIGHAFARRHLPLTQMLPAVGTVLIGIGLYLYLPLRFAAEPLFNYAGYFDAEGIFRPTQLNTIRGLWEYITAHSFSSSMFAYSVPELPTEISKYGMQLWRTFFAIGIGPGILGMIRSFEKHRPYGGMLLLMFLCNAFFFIDYRVIDKETMFLPTFVIWTLWLGIGYEELLGWFKGLAQDRIERWSFCLLQGLLCVSVLGAILWNWGLVEQAHQERGDVYGEQILEELEPNALLIGYWQVVPIVQYMQFIEGQRPDVMAMNRFLISAQDLEKLIQEEVVRRPVYIDCPPADLDESIRVTQSDVLYRLEPKDPPFLFWRGDMEEWENQEGVRNLFEMN